MVPHMTLPSGLNVSLSFFVCLFALFMLMRVVSGTQMCSAGCPYVARLGVISVGKSCLQR